MHHNTKEKSVQGSIEACTNNEKSTFCLLNTQPKKAKGRMLGFDQHLNTEQTPNVMNENGLNNLNKVTDVLEGKAFYDATLMDWNT